MSAFKKLLESELLNDDTKVALEEAIKSFKEEAITEAKKDLEVDYAKKMLAEKQEIAAKMTALINEAVTQEIEELKDFVYLNPTISTYISSKASIFCMAKESGKRSITSL